MGAYAGGGCGASSGTGPVVGGVWTSTGVILVLFILLVIISRALWI